MGWDTERVGLHLQTERCSSHSQSIYTPYIDYPPLQNIRDYIQVCDEPLSTVRVPDSGRYVAVGSQQGTVTVLELSERLSQLQPNEKQSTSAVRSPSTTKVA
jgi:hypothetical protein